MAFNPTNPVAVGLATKVDHYDRVFDNTLLLKTSIDDAGLINASVLLRTPEIRGYQETTDNPAISSGTLTVNLTNANVFRVSLNANITTLTIQNPASSPKHANFAIRFTADGTLRTITWPASVRWPGAVVPVMTSVNGKVDWLTFSSVDGGTTWDGFIMGQNL